MRLILTGALVLLSAGCSTSGKPASPEPIPSPFVMKADSPGSSEGDMSSSELLSKEKKCPKHSKLINGKCTLDVESDD